MAQNHVHATALLLGDRGILISGPSGSGKTTLALALIERFRGCDRFARLVADDQLLVHPWWDRLVAASPETIAGLAEVHGLGPRPVAYMPSAVVDLAVRLVAQIDAPRLSDPQVETIAGVSLPRLDLPARNTTASCLAISAWLDTAHMQSENRHAQSGKCVNMAEVP